MAHWSELNFSFKRSLIISEELLLGAFWNSLWQNSSLLRCTRLSRSFMRYTTSTTNKRIQKRASSQSIIRRTSFRSTDGYLMKTENDWLVGYFDSLDKVSAQHIIQTVVSKLACLVSSLHWIIKITVRARATRINHLTCIIPKTTVVLDNTAD